jgi:hypothetical protein
MVIFHSYVKLPEGTARRGIFRLRRGPPWATSENVTKTVERSLRRPPETRVSLSAATFMDANGLSSAQMVYAYSKSIPKVLQCMLYVCTCQMQMPTRPCASPLDVDALSKTAFLLHLIILP